jgi:hypothetical protein
MADHYYEPPVEDTECVLLDLDVVKTALQAVIACEACAPDSEFSFDSVLDRLTMRDPRITEYVMPTVVCCPTCGGEINEKTLIECDAEHWIFARHPHVNDAAGR